VLLDVCSWDFCWGFYANVSRAEGEGMARRSDFVAFRRDGTLFLGEMQMTMIRNHNSSFIGDLR